jgi:hypothetical protein
MENEQKYSFPIAHANQKGFWINAHAWLFKLAVALLAVYVIGVFAFHCFSIHVLFFCFVCAYAARFARLYRRNHFKYTVLKDAFIELSAENIRVIKNGEEQLFPISAVTYLAAYYSETQKNRTLSRFVWTFQRKKYACLVEAVDVNQLIDWKAMLENWYKNGIKFSEYKNNSRSYLLQLKRKPSIPSEYEKLINEIGTQEYL